MPDVAPVLDEVAVLELPERTAAIGTAEGFIALSGIMGALACSGSCTMATPPACLMNLRKQSGAVSRRMDDDEDRRRKLFRQTVHNRTDRTKPSGRCSDYDDVAVGMNDAEIIDPPQTLQRLKFTLLRGRNATSQSTATDYRSTAALGDEQSVGGPAPRRVASIVRRADMASIKSTPGSAQAR
jgi:hypothetical protein